MINIRNYIIGSLLIILTLIISIISGWRLVGIDRENYIAMYSGVASAETIALKLFYAKDITFLALAELFNSFTSDPRFLFFTYVFISFAFKFFLFKKISEDRFYVIVTIYFIFLSTVLEFVAFRSALSISFLLAAIYFKDNVKFHLFIVLSVLSHLSSILPALLIMPFVTRWLNKYKFFYLLLLIIPIFLNGNILNLFPQGNVYLTDQSGTFFAMFLPIITLILAGFIFFDIDYYFSESPDDKGLIFINNSKSLVFTLIYFSIGITPFIVTAATRYLEFVYCFLIIAGVILFRRSYVNFFGFLFFILLLAYLNISKGLWLNVFFPN